MVGFSLLILQETIIVESGRYQIIRNLALYQLAWFACVFGAAYSMPYLGSAVAFIIVAIHLHSQEWSTSEFAFIGGVTLVGVVFDSLLAHSGWVIYASHEPTSFLAPVWIMALWSAFATLFSVSLRWIKDRMPTALLLGALGGPLAYFAGERIGAIEILSHQPTYLALALGWTLVMALIVTAQTRLYGAANV